MGTRWSEGGYTFGEWSVSQSLHACHSHDALEPITPPPTPTQHHPTQHNTRTCTHVWHTHCLVPAPLKQHDITPSRTNAPVHCRLILPQHSRQDSVLRLVFVDMCSTLIVFRDGLRHEMCVLYATKTGSLRRLKKYPGLAIQVGMVVQLKRIDDPGSSFYSFDTSI